MPGGIGLTIVPQMTTGNVVIVAMMLGLAATWWIRGWPDRKRAVNEGDQLVRSDYASQIVEFRKEVHGYKNEVMKLQATITKLEGELRSSAAQSMRRGDKLNMVLFILRMVMDELYSKDPANKVLAQAKKLLERVEDEPHQPDNSEALSKAEDTVDAANETVRQVKADEAKKP